MALSASQRAALLRDIEGMGAAQDALADASVDAVSRSYGDALDASMTKIRRLARGIKTDSAGRLIPDLGAVASLSPTLGADNEPWRIVWQEWTKRMSALLKLQLDYASRVGNVNAVWLGSERSTLEALVGLWPAKGEPTQGLALRFYALTTGERARIANGLTQHMLGRLPSASLERFIDEASPSSTARVKQLVQDGTFQVVRTAHELKAESLGLSFFRYSGPADLVTRPFCTARVAKVYSREEIDKMDNGQTGEGTALIACGGYNCRHRWAGVNEEWYTPDEWANMRGK